MKINDREKKLDSDTKIPFQSVVSQIPVFNTRFDDYYADDACSNDVFFTFYYREILSLMMCLLLSPVS